MFKNTPEILISTYGLQKKFKNVVTIADQQSIYKHQRARLKIADDVPNEAIGLSFRRLQLSKTCLTREIKGLMLCADKGLSEDPYNKLPKAKLAPGQFLAAKKNTNQYMVTRQQYEWQIPLGQCVKTCQTFCFDQQFSAPSKDDEYLIGTIKGMNQFQVWEIKFKMQSKADDFKSEAEANLIAIKKGDIKMMTEKWARELDQW